MIVQALRWPGNFLLLQEPNLIHIRQIQLMQDTASDADAGDQSDQQPRLKPRSISKR